MGFVPLRKTLAPLRRAVTVVRAGRQPLTVAQAVALHRPEQPMHCVRPAVLVATARRFVQAFAGAAAGGAAGGAAAGGAAAGGDVLYAVKCNPEPLVLQSLWQGGVRHFDVASPGEIRLVRKLLPEAKLHYMHPVKARSAIRDAWHRDGVRDFALDGLDELAKILDETGAGPGSGPSDLGLMIRLAVPKGGALYDLSGKFGAERGEAVPLLRAARAVARRVGVTFHVGSQCLTPAAYRRAIALAGETVAEAGVAVDVIDVGGGFPVSYPGGGPPPLDDYMNAIAGGVVGLGWPGTPALWCEPGRALVAPAVSLVVRVIRRRGNELFINDGIYGSLSDAGITGFRFPARLVRPGAGPSAAADGEFILQGPTCDSADRMAGPFVLPDDVHEGDWIELGQLGAYGGCLRTGFNGFEDTLLVEVSDPPLMVTPGYEMASEAA
jgi:ornithine decarboxylase